MLNNIKIAKESETGNKMMESLIGKKLLLLGGTKQACDAVEVAKEMQIETFVADYYSDSPAKKIADHSFAISTHDVDKLIRLCREEHIDGVITVALEDALPYYVEICKRLNLPCYISDEQLSLFTKKNELKKICIQANLPVIPEFSIDKVSTTENLKKITYPIIIKPSDNCASRGISVCYRPDDVLAAIHKALDNSTSKTFLAEKYMQCEDVILNYTFAEGEYRLSLMGDRFVSNEYPGMGSVTKALIYPSIHLAEYLETTHSHVCNMFHKAKIRDGVMFIQAFYEDGKFYCYDPGYRTCGAQVYKMVKAANRVPQMEMLIRHALTGSMGDRELLERNDPSLHGRSGCNLVVLSKAGKVGRIEGAEKVEKHPAVINYTQFLNVGDEVTQIGTLKQTFARIHFLCDTRKELREAVEEVQKILKVENIYGNNMLLPDFDTNNIQDI